MREPLARLRFEEQEDATILLLVSGPSRRFLPARFQIDTGSSKSLVMRELAPALGLDLLARSPRRLGTAVRHDLLYTPARLHLGARALSGPEVFVTVDGGFAAVEQNVLGRDFLSHFHLSWWRRVVTLSLEREEDL